MLFALLFACQEPFGTDRHVLEGDRIAAVAVSRTGDEVTLVPALVVDGHLWSDEDVRIERTDADGASTLTVTFPSGAVREAVATWPEQDGATVIADVSIGVVDGLDVDTVTAAEVAVEARAALTASPADVVPDGGFARFAAEAPEGAFLRWMGGGGGTFFELDPHTADWAAGTVVFDDEEVVARAPRGAGVEGMLALALGADGTTGWRAFDVCVGDPVGLDVNGRRLPIDGVPEAGFWHGELAADDALPAGLRLDAAVRVEVVDLPLLDPYGTEALDCAETLSGPFDPSWLASGTCTRSDVVGASVVVEAR